MNNVISLDKNYSTTRRVIKADPQEIAGLVKQSNKPEDKFETVLFLPEGENRQGEGGLRTKGYFKVGGLISENDVCHSERSEGSPQSSPLTPSSSQVDKPLITVVTVVFNGEKFLEETILSVINQTYDNVEYIIIDGGSTDGTLDIIKKYEHAIDYWVSEKDKGIYDAMNKGIDLAMGEWINFMNADDYFASNDVAESVVKNLPCITSSCSIIYGSLEMIKAPGVTLTLISNPSDSAKKNIISTMTIPHQSQFANHVLIKKIGKFNSDYKIAADYELTIRLLTNHDCYFLKNLLIAKMRVGGISSDPESSLKMLDEYRKAQKQNDIKIKMPFLLARIRVYIRLFLWKLFGEVFTRKALDFGNRLLGRKTYWVKAQK